nr:hypothetical protein [Thermoanaerobaculia bacterium]
MSDGTAPATSPSFLEAVPPWAATLVRSVRAKQANTFLLHGTTADLVPVRGNAGLRFVALDSFLSQELLAGWPSVVTYNRAEGLGFSSLDARKHFEERVRAYDGVRGTNWAQALPRDAPNCFALLDSYFKACAAASPARPVDLLLPFA